MKKRLISLLLAGILLLPGVLQPAQASNLKLSDWATNDYHLANEYGILNWFQRDTDFTVPITRAEFCDMVFSVVKSADHNLRNELDVCRPDPFTDTDRYSVFCLEQLGIAKGVGNGRFDPQGTLTREQAATFMARAAEIIDFTYIPEETTPFTDEDRISDWAKDAAGTMQEAGLIIGTDQGAFLPGQYLTREQAAAILVRFYQKNGCNLGLTIRNTSGNLTLEDFEELNGKYRSTGRNSYEITYYQGKFCRADLKVRNGRIISAVYTHMNSGKQINMLKKNWRDRIPPYDGRTYLGGDAYAEIKDGTARLEIAGETILSIPVEDRMLNINYLVMDGKPVATCAEDNNYTVFRSTPDGEELFRVKGYLHCITNKYIITEQYRYSAPTVDSAYTVYLVYDLRGNLVDEKEYDHNGLYWAGYITDY